MSARLVHDFKNQLSGLKLYAAYLKKRFADQPEGVEIAEKIIHSLNEMAENAALVSRLMRPLELRCEKGNLAALVKQIVAELQAQAAPRSISVQTELDDELPALSFDKQQLRAALFTIIGRALAVTGEGGQVRLTLHAADAAAQLAITDQGEPLGEEQRESLFEMLTNERLNKAQLELALARRTIELHDGFITARAAAPTGTAVQVRLPV